MSEKRRGLGRGLGALIPSSAAGNGSGNGRLRHGPWTSSFRRAEKRWTPPSARMPVTRRCLRPHGSPWQIGGAAPPRMLRGRNAGRRDGRPPSEARHQAAGGTAAAKAPAKARRARTAAEVRKTTPDSPRRREPPGAASAATKRKDVEDNGVDLVEVPACASPRSRYRHPPEPQTAPFGLR